jgi:predicted TIM-barrel fold metal-dependent hydrolase
MISLIDTHQHLVYRNKITYSWTKDIPPLAVDNFTLENYKDITQDLGIGGTLFMETGVDDEDYQKETQYVNTLKDNNQLIGIIASIRPETNEGFDSWLNDTLEMGVVGYRRVLHIMPNEMSESNIFRENIRKIGAFEKTFDMCFLPNQLKIAKELAQACDNTPLVLNHCGVPSIANNELDPWREDIKSLSEVANVTCKLSGLMAYCAPGTSSYQTIEPYVNHVLECFGPSRIVWGSDWPVVNLGKGLKEWIEVTREILGKLSSGEAEDIANRTAQKIYKVSL